MRETQAKPRLLVLVATLALALATAALSLAVFAAEARASEASFDSLPPKAALMKGSEVLQAQSFEGAQ